MPQTGLSSVPAIRNSGLIGIGDLLDITRWVVDSDHALGWGVGSAQTTQEEVPGGRDGLIDADQIEIRIDVADQGDEATNDKVGGSIGVGASGGLVVEHDAVTGAD